MAVIDRTEETLSSTKKVFGIFSRVRDAWNARKEPYSEVTAQWKDNCLDEMQNKQHFQMVKEIYLVLENWTM